MTVAVKSNTFPAPQLRTSRGMSSTELIPPPPPSSRWLLHTDTVRRGGALAFFVLAILTVVFSASGAVAQVDSDNDGLGDEVEGVVHGTDPNNGDSDFDGLPDGVEVSLGTNPMAADTDGDGVSDAEEYLSGEDPLVATFEPVAVAITPVPVTVVSGSDSSTATTAQVTSSVTVSPESIVGVVPASLAFDTSDPGGRSPFFPLYALVVSAISVGMLALLKRIPRLE